MCVCVCVYVHVVICSIEINEVQPKAYHREGISIVIINNKSGEKLLNILQERLAIARPPSFLPLNNGNASSPITSYDDAD